MNTRLRKADQEQKRQKRAATRDAYRVANQRRMAARRALEWIRCQRPVWCLDMKYQTCSNKICGNTKAGYLIFRFTDTE